MIQDYSVLMAVYIKDNPEYFRQSIQSMLNQTYLTNDFVIVCDGPLLESHNRIIDNFQKNYSFFNIVRLEKNSGLGTALNFGIKLCRNELVARMDSDDISLPNRCEIQIDKFNEDPELSIISSAILEYDNKLQKMINVKKVPITSAEINEKFTRRNPFNHPVVMYKKSKVLEVGSYQDFYLLEDYFLWIRMLSNCVKGYNIEEPLLKMRTGYDMIQRRGGWKYFKSNYKLQSYLRNQGYITNHVFFMGIVVRFFVQILMPTKVRYLVYKHILRSKK